MKKVERPELDALIERAKETEKAMTPEEKDVMWKAQQESWVRGELGIGLDVDEAEWRRAFERLKDDFAS